MRRRRHFTRGSEGGIQEGVGSLGFGFPQYSESLVAITTSNPRESPVRLRESELGRDAVTLYPGEKVPPTTTFPTLEFVHSFLPRKARRDTLNPVSSAFIGPWKP